MARFEGNTFIGQRVLMDGNQFLNNRFQNCLLVYSGGPLVMRDNVLNNVQWQFIDAAERTVGLLSSFYQQGGQSRQLVESLLMTFGKPLEPPKATPSEEGSTPASVTPGDEK